MLKATTVLHRTGLLAVALCALALAACATSTPAEQPSTSTTDAPASAPTVTSPSPVPTKPPPAPADPTPATLVPTVTEGNQAQSEATLVQLADPLDEPEFYCVDVPGFGASLNLQAALMAHTCKPGADDEIFLVGLPGPGNLSMPAYKLCMEAEGAETQAPLRLQECSDSAMQQFDYDADGALILSGTGLCVAVSPEDGETTGGPSHVRRDLLLLDCAEAQPALSRWVLPGASPQ